METVAEVTLVKVAVAAEAERAVQLVQACRDAKRELGKFETAERNSLGAMASALVNVGRIVAGAKDAKLVSSVNAFAWQFAGCATAAERAEVIGGRVSGKGAAPGQVRFNNAYRLAQSLGDGDVTTMAADYRDAIAMRADLGENVSASLTSGPFSLLAWQLAGRTFAPIAPKVESKSATFAPRKLAERVSRVAKLSPAQQRQLAAMLVKLADAAESATGSAVTVSAAA